MSTAYLGLGSNMGNRTAYLQDALDRLTCAGKVTAVSPVFETAPLGFLDQPLFLNAACALMTTLSPYDLLDTVKTIESKVGRISTFLNGPREIDIDILFFDHLQIDTPELTIPHPRMHERAFVLIPLSIIAPDEIHPVLGTSIRSLANKLKIDDVKSWGTMLTVPKGCEHV